MIAPQVTVTISPFDTHSVRIDVPQISQLIWLHVTKTISKQFMGLPLDNRMLENIKYTVQILLNHLIEANYIAWDHVTQRYEIIEFLPGSDMRDYYKYYYRR
jgi:hypothetical protein